MPKGMAGKATDAAYYVKPPPLGTPPPKITLLGFSLTVKKYPSIRPVISMTTATPDTIPFCVIASFLLA